MASKTNTHKLISMYPNHTTSSRLFQPNSNLLRYGSKTEQLRPHFSEFGLIRARVEVEVAWLESLIEFNVIPCKITHEQQLFFRGLHDVEDGFDLEAAERVKTIERTTNHDVKAVEYFMKEKFLARFPESEELSEFFHFACTSEDINNVSYALMLKRALEDEILPMQKDLILRIVDMAEQSKAVPVLCRTHGQPATPSTLGKEVGNFAYRLSRQYKRLKACEMPAKMNGAVGNYAAHLVVLPDTDWPLLSKSLLEKKLGLSQNPYTTQIEPHDGVSEVCDITQRFNTVLLDMSRDMWGYISLGYFQQKVIEGEIGSSTMPHKVNPIDFENSEGNIGLGNALLHHLSTKLPVSRFQRDLSDSTVMRSLGSGFAHSVIAYQAATRGLSRVSPNPTRMSEELDVNWEVLAEPIQTVMRLHGQEAPYEKLKELTRGKKVDAQAMLEFTQGLEGILRRTRLGSWRSPHRRTQDTQRPRWMR